MANIKRLTRRWSTDPALANLELQDAKHVIDALTLAMLADYDLADREEDTFEELLGQLTLPGKWSEVAELHNYARQSCRDAMKAASVSSDTVLEKASAIGAKIPAEVHAQVFGMLIAISVADRAIEASEGHLLTRFAEAFGLDETKAEALYKSTLEALDLVADEEA